MKRFSLILLFLLSLSLPAMADSGAAQRAARQRLNGVGLHQLGLGLDFGQGHNSHLGAHLGYMLGSQRMLLNGTAAVGYQAILPGVSRPSQELYGHFLPLSLGLRCNYLRWHCNRAYLGLTGAYNLNVGNQSVFRSYADVQGLLGLRLSALDLSLGYTYDLAPAYCQRYLFETPGYDFRSLHASAYERMHVALRLTYYFTLGL